MNDISYKRRVLIYYAIREYQFHHSEAKTYKDIQDYQKMNNQLIEQWYDKWFKMEDKK